MDHPSLVTQLPLPGTTRMNAAGTHVRGNRSWDSVVLGYVTQNVNFTAPGVRFAWVTPLETA